MSATAFQRRRRELARLEEEKKQKQVETYEEFDRSQLERVKNDDLKARLDQLEIEYSSDAVKKDLIDLLIGEEVEETDEEPQEENDEEINEDSQEDNEEEVEEQEEVEQEEESQEEQEQEEQEK